VREFLGPEARIRVDANGAWTAREAVAKINAMAFLNLEAVEQPVAKNDLEGLAEVTKQVSPAVLADESVCNLVDARRLIDNQAVDGFNLRLSKCGGPYRTIELLDMAEKSGLICQLGCHVGELGLLSAAGRHLAEARRHLVYLEGSLTHFVFGRDVIYENISFGYAGIAPNLPGPGLGVNIREDALKDSLIFHLP
jgi:muconate cycloisomerase